jgi:hypothetical protein
MVAHLEKEVATGVGAFTCSSPWTTERSQPREFSLNFSLNRVAILNDLLASFDFGRNKPVNSDKETIRKPEQLAMTVDPPCEGMGCSSRLSQPGSRRYCTIRSHKLMGARTNLR